MQDANIITLDGTVDGGCVIFSPVSYNRDAQGNLEILCSLNNKYLVPFIESVFIENFTTIFDKMQGDRYSLICTRNRNGNWNCSVM